MSSPSSPSSPTPASLLLVKKKPQQHKPSREQQLKQRQQRKKRKQADAKKQKQDEKQQQQQRRQQQHQYLDFHATTASALGGAVVESHPEPPPRCKTCQSPKVSVELLDELHALATMVQRVNTQQPIDYDECMASVRRVGCTVLTPHRYMAIASALKSPERHNVNNYALENHVSAAIIDVVADFTGIDYAASILASASASISTGNASVTVPTVVQTHILKFDCSVYLQQRQRSIEATGSGSVSECYQRLHGVVHLDNAHFAWEMFNDTGRMAILAAICGGGIQFCNIDTVPHLRSMFGGKSLPDEVFEPQPPSASVCVKDNTDNDADGADSTGDYLIDTIQLLRLILGADTQQILTETVCCNAHLATESAPAAAATSDQQQQQQQQQQPRCNKNGTICLSANQQRARNAKKDHRKRLMLLQMAQHTFTVGTTNTFSTSAAYAPINKIESPTLVDHVGMHAGYHPVMATAVAYTFIHLPGQCRCNAGDAPPKARFTNVTYRNQLLPDVQVCAAAVQPAFHAVEVIFALLIDIFGTFGAALKKRITDENAAAMDSLLGEERASVQQKQQLDELRRVAAEQRKKSRAERRQSRINELTQITTTAATDQTVDAVTPSTTTIPTTIAAAAVENTDNTRNNVDETPTVASAKPPSPQDAIRALQTASPFKPPRLTRVEQQQLDDEVNAFRIRLESWHR